MLDGKCSKNPHPQKFHDFEKGICKFCDQDTFDFEREVIKLVVRRLVEADALTTGVLSGMRRELAENRPMDKKLEKFIKLVTRGTIRDFSKALNSLLDDVGYISDDDHSACSDDREPPPYNEGYE